MTFEAPTEPFLTGDTLLDAQHAKLLALCRRADRLRSENRFDDTENFHIILNDLATFAQEHFKAEEELLRKYDPQLLAEHLAEHIAYESQLTELLISASHGIFDKTRLIDFLTDWWLSHGLQSDMRLRDALKRG